MNKSFRNPSELLNPYSKIKLDCYQNSELTLLNYLGCNVTLLGGQWPWGFYIKGDMYKSPLIRNKYMVETSHVKKLLGISIEKESINDSEAIVFKRILEVMKSCPVIVNLDQYMVSHHYPHIFNKQHGPHSLILQEYKDEEESFMCVDSIPEYKGMISKDLVLAGIFNYPEEAGGKLTLTYIQNQEGIRQPNQTELFEEFISSLSIRDDSYLTDELFDLINFQFNNLSSDQFFNWAALLCRGTWIWEFDRNALLTIEYLRFINKLGYVSADVINELSNLNTRLNVIIKKFYKMVISRKITAMEATLDELNILLDFEKKIKGRLSLTKEGNR